MEVEETGTKRARGRGRGSRARGRGRGRGRGSGRKATRIVSSDEETTQTQVIDTSTEEIAPVVPQVANVEEQIVNSKGNESDPPPIEEIVITTIDMEADISQLEAPTFTTISRGPPEPMLRLKWDHKVSLIGEKVLNPMIHCCDECEKPILVYGRMILCKHIFCLKCARAEPLKVCPRCKDKVLRVEQSGLGTVFMCTHGGSRYGNTGCRRTYLSQRDLQAHINHRHVTPPTINTESSIIKPLQLVDNKTINPTQRKSTDPASSTTVSSAISSRPQQRSSSQQFGSNISVVQTSVLQSRNNLINVPIQEAQQAMGKVSIQPVSAQSSISQSLMTHHGSEALGAANYYCNVSSGTYSAPTAQNVLTQNYGTVSSISSQSGNVHCPTIPSISTSSVHNIQLVSQTGAHISSRSSGVPPPPTPPQAPAYYAAYGQQYGQMSQYHYDQSNYSGNTQNPQWNQQQYYR